jgi:hypothetical protein
MHICIHMRPSAYTEELCTFVNFIVIEICLFPNTRKSKVFTCRGTNTCIHGENLTHVCFLLLMLFSVCAQVCLACPRTLNPFTAHKSKQIHTCVHTGAAPGYSGTLPGVLILLRCTFGVPPHHHTYYRRNQAGHQARVRTHTSGTSRQARTHI